MGRELKRVSKDFKWPIGSVWKGYINPYRPTECKACGGTGLNPETKKLKDDWYALDNYTRYAGWCYRLEQSEVDALVQEGRLMDLTRRPRNQEQVEQLKKQAEAGGSNYWMKDSNGHHPTAEEVNEWAKKGFGHDSINCWICVESRAKRLGIYGKCNFCKGNGHYFCEEKYEELYDTWESIEPPEGDGWQMWETVTEGSPISPVCNTPEELARWLADNKASSFGSDTATYEQWLTMINGSGFAMSMVVDAKGVRSGVEAISDR